MNRTHIVIATGCLALAAVAVWLWLHPVAPIHTPSFDWRQGGDKRHELVVKHQGVRVQPPQPPRYSSAALSSP